MNHCAPGKFDSKNNTCFTIDQLLEMSKAYNRYLTINKFTEGNLNKSAKLIDIRNDKKYLLKELYKRFNNICKNNEKCITKQDFMNEIVKEMREDILNNTFRPEGPEKSTEWLTTNNINKIMEQYEKKYSNFKFLGAVPLDCNEVSFCSLYQLDYNDLLEKNKTKIGIVFNHDKFGSPGSHWVALFIDISKGELNFTDSSGSGPIKNILQVIKEFKKWYKKNFNKNAIVKINNKKYQTDSSECGVYSINFIIQRLAGNTFEDIISKPLKFEEINSCRNVYFNNKPSKFNINEKCDP